MGIFSKKTTVVHFNDCTRCNGQGSVVVTVDPKDAPSVKGGYKGEPFKIREAYPKCSGTGNKGPR